MNAKRYASILRGLTSLARKVLECVPKVEPADQHKILAEYQRVNGSIAFRALQGTLHSLVESKLVKVRGERFVQVEIAHDSSDPDDDENLYPDIETDPAPAPVSSFEEDMNKTFPTPATPAITNPTAAMETLAERLRTMSHQMNQLASQVEEAAIQYEMKLEQVGKDTEKLRQLQALLKSLG